MKKVLILGGNGYIGSRLRQVLREHHFVKSNDICWHAYDETSDRRDYCKIIFSKNSFRPKSLNEVLDTKEISIIENVLNSRFYNEGFSSKHLGECKNI